MKTLAIIGLMAGAIIALLARLKGSSGGRRKARLEAAKKRLEEGAKSLAAKRAATEAALAHQVVREEAMKAGKVLSDQKRKELAENEPDDADDLKRQLDDWSD